MRTFFSRFPVISRLIVAAIVLALVGLLIWGCWSLAYNQGWVSHAPTWDFASLVNGGTREGVLALQPVPTAEPQSKAPPTAQPTDAPASEPTKAPEAKPAQPTAPPTDAPATSAYTPTGKTVSFTLKDQNGKESQVVLHPFTYKSGWRRGTDSWFVAKDGNLAKETPESFGIPISGDDWANRIENWLKAAISDPWSLTWFRFQMHLEDFSSMEKANKCAVNLSKASAEKYDEAANAALEKFFKRIDGGRAEVDPGWDLEVMLREPKKGKTLELFARKNTDANHTPDTLVAFYSKGESTSFTSYKKAWAVAAEAAGVNANHYKPRAYVNLTEGGTWKWKATGRSNGKGDNPTDAPTSTPSPKPDGNRKDPKVRPTPPTGGGEVNPKNSSDPHTKRHTGSTPTPKVTETPTPTPTPTPVPTAITRPEEDCATSAPLVREDKNAPSSDGKHNVPSSKPEGEANDSFDPGSI